MSIETKQKMYIEFLFPKLNLKRERSTEANNHIDEFLETALYQLPPEFKVNSKPSFRNSQQGFRTFLYRTSPAVLEPIFHH